MYAYIAYINHKFIFFLKGQESTCHEQKPDHTDPKQPHDLAHKTPPWLTLWKMKQVPSWMEHLLLQGSVFGKVTVDFLIGTKNRPGVFPYFLAKSMQEQYAYLIPIDGFGATCCVGLHAWKSIYNYQLKFNLVDRWM